MKKTKIKRQRLKGIKEDKKEKYPFFTFPLLTFNFLTFLSRRDYGKD